MNSEGRKVLSLNKSGEAGGADVERTVAVGIFDVQLPARHYLVHHKVAEVGQVSFTTEFLLRLLYSVDGMTEGDVADFFGFNARELAFVVDEPEAKGYLTRADGRIWISDAGLALFKEDAGRPQIYEVVKRQERVGFDLLSLAPCERDGLSAFERALPELSVRNDELVAHASKYVPDKFRRFYGDIVGRKTKDIADSLKKSLYSVDDVVAGERFSALVPFIAEVSIRKPGDPEPVLDRWMPAHELDDREEVVHAVGEFLDGLKVFPAREDENAYELLAEFAPEFMKDYVVKGGISVSRFFKETARRAGELRSDRRTVGIIGSLYLPENSKRLLAAINYSSPPAHGDDEAFIWFYPDRTAWGASRAFVSLVEKLCVDGVPQVSTKDKRERSAILVGCGRPERYISRHLSQTYDRPNNGSVPGALEVLLIPQRVAAVAVHSPILGSRGYPVPLGFVSFDSNVVRRVQRYLQVQMPASLGAHDGGGSYDLGSRLVWPDEGDAAAGHSDSAS